MTAGRVALVGGTALVIGFVLGALTCHGKPVAPEFVHVIDTVLADTTHQQHVRDSLSGVVQHLAGDTARRVQAEQRLAVERRRSDSLAVVLAADSTTADSLRHVIPLLASVTGQRDSLRSLYDDEKQRSAGLAIAATVRDSASEAQVHRLQRLLAAVRDTLAKAVEPGKWSLCAYAGAGSTVGLATVPGASGTGLALGGQIGLGLCRRLVGLGG